MPWEGIGLLSTRVPSLESIPSTGGFESRNPPPIMIKNNLYHGDCIDIMKTLPEESIDLVVTSPPYDNLRTYNGSLEWGFDVFRYIANQLYRVIKKGGVVVWVVGDATIKGSETGTSFKQALYFKEVVFNLHDTMIYQKLNHAPYNHNRYEQSFEYMFVLSRGRPNTFNPIKIKCTHAGRQPWGEANLYKDNSGKMTRVSTGAVRKDKVKDNIFAYRGGSFFKKTGHPAVFPEKLASDHIVSWSNPGDTVMDPMMGSGTVGKMCKQLGRNFIGIEKELEYFNIAKVRIND